MTTAPVVDVREHASAIKELLDTQLAPHKSYDFDEVPGGNRVKGTLPNIYVTITIERRHVPPARQVARAGRSGWRLSCRYAGRSMFEAGHAALCVAQALDEVRLVIDGVTSSVVTHESSRAPQWDDGRYTGLTQFIYAL